MEPSQRIDLERSFHESEDVIRDKTRLIPGLYASGLFDEAEAYLLDVLGDIEGLRVSDSGCGTGDTMRQSLGHGAAVAGFDLSHTRLELARTVLTILAYTVKLHSGTRMRKRNSKLPGLRDAILGRWGEMGIDVERICFPQN